MQRDNKGGAPKNDKLQLWQQRLAEANSAQSAEVQRMDRRERQYNGERLLRPLTGGDTYRDGEWRQTSHVRNVTYELIEAQTSSSIPQPKVTPLRREDERLADLIERFERNELDRLPMEEINDMAERTVPLQGGVYYYLEWDPSYRSHESVGATRIRLLHPKQVAPQPGIYTSIDDMDWVILKIPTTKTAVFRKYGVSVEAEAESEPDVRAAAGAEPCDEALTEYIGFAHNENGGIDRYCWVNDIELEDLENYQARRQPVCARCGRVRPLPGQLVQAERAETPPPAGKMDDMSMVAGRLLADRMADELMLGTGEGGPGSMPVSVPPPSEPVTYDGGACPWCGSTEFTSQEQDYEQVFLPIQTSSFTIPGAAPGFDAEGQPAMIPTLVPYYRPDVYPLVLQKSVSVFGQLLGNSDADAIADQQNTINRLEQKIIDRLIKAGTRVTLPSTLVDLRVDTDDMEIWRVSTPAEKNLIDTVEFTGNLEYEMVYLANVYEEARQTLGITDSFQGRRDATATSGKAKEFSAAQAAGRLESKRQMKMAAYQRLFELMFRFWLAYGDEPRRIVYRNERGEREYGEINRYEFLKRDSSGAYYWADDFLFSCDSSAPLASNREALWQETRMNLDTGAFGDPTATETLILFWAKMAELHYPGAADTQAYLEQRLQREQMEAESIRREQALFAAQRGGALPGAGTGRQISPQAAQAATQLAQKTAPAL